MYAHSAWKKEAWLEAVKQLNSPEAKPAADSIRENAGVHEERFLKKHQMETLLYLHMKAKISGEFWKDNGKFTC